MIAHDFWHSKGQTVCKRCGVMRRTLLRKGELVVEYSPRIVAMPSELADPSVIGTCKMSRPKWSETRPPCSH